MNNSTVTDFVDDRATFDRFVNECFAIVDENRDGVLSPKEVRDGFRRLLPFGSESQPQREMDEGLLGLIFERFDEDRNGKLDKKEFKSLMTEIMHAVARGIGGSPIIVALEKDSFLMKAVQHELAARPSSL